MTQFSKCPNCKGSGLSISGTSCIDCSGRGQMTHESARLLQQVMKLNLNAKKGDN